MIGKFGTVFFSVSDEKVQNFIGLKRDTPVRYANHETVNTKPKSEFLGPGLMSLSFSMELSVFQGVNPKTLLNSLRRYLYNGTVERFVLGGRSFGKYKITALSESYGIITNRGVVVSAKVDVTMEEYA